MISGVRLVALHMARFINGGNIAKEYFSTSNDQLKFVRAEDDKGRAVQNEYIYPNLEIGLVPDARTVGEWIRLLESQDKTDVLSALVFLGGRHLSEPQRDSLPGDLRESGYAGLFRHLIGDPRIHKLIERLGGSDNSWVREAAGLAVRGPRERSLR